ncbi:hypothetical protein O3P69_018304 [Scylla paramamosain]|uniref:Uncharacterized protein n=1 Tax=Scylla paramamosain TaxID=85552 RepID=A0AAW0TJ32_SCYPA
MVGNERGMWWWWWWRWWCVVVVLSAVLGRSQAYSSTYSASGFSKNVTNLLDSLLANYDRRIRPGHGGKYPSCTPSAARRLHPQTASLVPTTLRGARRHGATRAAAWCCPVLVMAAVVRVQEQQAPAASHCLTSLALNCNAKNFITARRLF